MNTVTTTHTPIVLLVGRVLIGVLFLVAGIMKVFNVAGTTAYMTRLGFPVPELFTYLSIVIEVGGGILLIIGWQTRRIAWFLALYVLVALGAAHRFWEYEPAQRVNQINHFLKNLAIIGGLVFVAVFGPGSASVDKS